jgi:hypothetical protein
MDDGKWARRGGGRPWLRVLRWVVLAVPLGLAACTGAPLLPANGVTPLSTVLPAPSAGRGLDQLPPGAWGGEHVALTSTADGVQLQIDCDRGAIPQPLALDATGAFDAPGSYTWCPAACYLDLPARYTGRLDGTTLTLQVAWTDPNGQAKTGGPFQVTLGGTAQLRSECPK